MLCRVATLFFKRTKCVNGARCLQMQYKNKWLLNSNANNENNENIIESLNKSIMYKLYPFMSAFLLGPIGYYMLDIVAAPLELQINILIVPITMDVIHWLLINQSLKQLKNKQSNLQQFGNKLKYLSRFSWGTAVVSQCVAFGLVIINPLESIMIDSLSVYGKILVTLSPMTPFLFSLINHETIFNHIRNEIEK